MSQSQPQAAAPEASNKAYIFKRDFRSSMRLNFNHYLMREVAGYLTHPHIPMDGPDVRIADIGTGTGIWACELATKLGSAVHVDAFDISDAQYPAPAFRPANVNFYVHNSFQAYPPEFVGQYDVVHVRFVMCHVDDSNAQALLQQLLSLAKPGGWLQWFEPLPRATQVRVDASSAQAGAPTAASERLAQIWHNLDPLGTYSWVENLKALCDEAGLQNVLQVDMWNTKDGGLTANFIEELQLEIAQGVAVDTPFQCVIGRKAQ